MFSQDLLELIRGGFTLGCGVAAAGLAYSTVLETSTITTEMVSFRLPRIGAAFHGFRVAQISDLHFRPYTGEREVNAAIDAASALSPDLVVLTGDFVTSTWIFQFGRRTADGIEECAELLQQLHAPYGVFAVLGNHDWGTDGERVDAALTAAGIRVLRNEAVPLDRRGSRLWLAGVDDALYGRADIDGALAGIPADEPVLLLAHEPDYADIAARYSIDLQLSGHSHGGQIVAPMIGAPYLPPLGRKYPRGHYRVRNMHLYTNRGIGVGGAPVRFNAPPEVTLVRLLAGAAVGEDVQLCHAAQGAPAMFRPRCASLRGDGVWT